MWGNENKTMSTMRTNIERVQLPQGSQRSSRGWVGSLLPTLRAILSAAVVCTVLSCTGAESNGSASGDDGRGGGGDIQVSGAPVCDLPGDGAERKELASGSRSQNWKEPGGIVWGLQQRYRVSPRRSQTYASSNYIPIETFCLSLNVFWEARDQSIAGQVAVAQVTMNRVASPDYPDDVCGVVHQHKQFSWYWDGKSDVPQEAAAWDRAQMVAMGVLAGSGHSDLMDMNITHYHAVTVKPYWAPTMKLVAQIENHIFYNVEGGT